MGKIKEFKEKLSSIEELKPIKEKKKKIIKPQMLRGACTIVGVKTSTSRFLPVSHEGYSNETFVDKVNLLGEERAEFISRKLKGIERREHMSLSRELIEELTGKPWKEAFDEIYGSKEGCIIPDGLCLACWNCSLFGGLQTGKGAVFSRIRYFDSYSVESAEDCVAMTGSDEGMGIGNTVSENVNKDRGADSYHLYEYVKPGTHFPFITIIENPTYLDIAGYINAVKAADKHGYGKYSANHGKFQTKFLAISTGYPKFSVLDMLEWAKEDPDLKQRFVGNSDKMFEQVLHDPITLVDSDIEEVAQDLKKEFEKYLEVLKG